MPTEKANIALHIIPYTNSYDLSTLLGEGNGRPGTTNFA
ncbi:MAG: hypothetical protein ACI845_002720 [Gammaproteobacteria bacterium]|jgi:hypothetical protein